MTRTSDVLRLVAPDAVAIRVTAGSMVVIGQLGPTVPLHLDMFALDDPRVHLSAGHSRFQGFHLAAGHLLVSTPPRYQPMMLIETAPPDVVIDLLEPGCDRRVMPPDASMTCTDLLARAIQGHGLSSHEVHDAVGLWLSTGWTQTGEMIRLPNAGHQGGAVRLLALMDILLVVATCIAPDLGPPGSREGGAVTIGNLAERRLDEVADIVAPFAGLASTNRPRPSGLRPTGSADLRPMAGYEPHYQGVPIEHHEVTVTMTVPALAELRERTGLPADASDAHVVRFALMEQVTSELRQPPLLRRGRPAS